MTWSKSYRRILNKLGYYNYQQGLIYRHLKQGEAWNSHLENCRNFILKAVDFYKPGRVTVLGSGWLLDLPLAEILETTDSVTLIDIVHPPEVISQVTGLEKVRLLESDITGGLIEEVWAKAGKKSLLCRLKTLDDIIVPGFELPDDPGMVISLNILTQLELLPVEYLKKQRCIDEEDFKRFRAAIQKKHIDFLLRYKSVLISDKTEVSYDKSDNATDIPSVLTDIPEGKFSKEWTWNFDLTRSDYFGKRSIYKVVAIIM
jgi:hypothetical protein